MQLHLAARYRKHRVQFAAFVALAHHGLTAYVSAHRLAHACLRWAGPPPSLAGQAHSPPFRTSSGQAQSPPLRTVQAQHGAQQGVQHGAQHGAQQHGAQQGTQRGVPQGAQRGVPPAWGAWETGSACSEPVE